jgi:hypothetical protein
MSGLRDAIYDALAFELVGDSDPLTEVDTIFAAVVKALHRDGRFPRLNAAQFDLIFADAKRDAEAALEPYVNVDLDDVERAIWRAITDHIAEQKQENATS